MAAAGLAVLTACATGGAPAAESGTGFRGGSGSVTWADLEFRVTLLRSGPDRIRARGSVTSRRERTVSALVPGCLVHLRIYRGSTLVWDRQRARGDCAGMWRQVNLRPGEEETAYLTVSAAEVLGDRHPSGLYTVRAYVPRDDRPDQPVRTAMEFTVGDARLVRPDEPDAGQTKSPGAKPGLSVIRWSD